MIGGCSVVPAFRRVDRWSCSLLVERSLHDRHLSLLLHAACGLTFTQWWTEQVRESSVGDPRVRVAGSIFVCREHNVYMTDATTGWDQSAIVVLPALPGDLSSPSDGQPIYPASTLAFVKILRGAGYPVRVATPEDVREVSHHGADEWLPVVNFGLQVLAGGAGNVLAVILMRLFDANVRRKTVTHIRWNVQAADGSVHEFAFDGNGENAIEAARAFEHSLGYGDSVG